MSDECVDLNYHESRLGLPTVKRECMSSPTSGINLAGLNSVPMWREKTTRVEKRSSENT